jgi:two-component system cell cycle sensor histidine kinase/response regulator CckA
VADTSSPSDALAILANRACDLLLSDIAMPEQSGPVLVAQARAAHPDLRVLYMSGEPDAARAGDAHPLATAEVIPKPFTAEQLIGRVGQALCRPAGTRWPRT